jgi:hypothetical protein
MKWNCIYTVFLVSSLLTFGCKAQHDQLFGEWRGVTSSGNHSIFLKLDKTNHAVFQIGNPIVGGNNNNVPDPKNRKIDLVYKVDYTKEPFTIDFIITIDGVNNIEPFIKGIFRFVAENKMELRALTGYGQRVNKFDSSDKENTTVLTKVPF